MKILLLFIFLFNSIIVSLYDDFIKLSTFYFYFLLLYLFIDLYFDRKIKLIHIWNIGFIYMILSEGFINEGHVNNMNSLLALKLLLYANNTVILGYLVRNHKYIERNKQDAFYLKKKKFGEIFLWLMLLFFCISQTNYVLKIYTIGRLQVYETLDSSFYRSIVFSLGFVLPAIMAFYYKQVKKKSLIIPFIYSTPIFILFFFSGTRFYLLFSVLGFLLTISSSIFFYINFKKILVLSSIVIILVQISNFIKNSRFENNNLLKNENINLSESIPKYLSKNYFSNEGSIEMVSLLIPYFENHEHLYGKSSSFLFYFWIPRSIWPEKPKMLGYWFIRNFKSNIPDSHSVSFGFVGDLYADFGYFSMFGFFLIGGGLKKVETLKRLLLKEGSFNSIIGIMLYPVIFFFVRDPITSLMNFIGILFFFKIAKLVLIKQIRLETTKDNYLYYAN